MTSDKPPLKWLVAGLHGELIVLNSQGHPDAIPYVEFSEYQKLEESLIIKQNMIDYIADLKKRVSEADIRYKNLDNSFAKVCEENETLNKHVSELEGQLRIERGQASDGYWKGLADMKADEAKRNREECLKLTAENAKLRQELIDIQKSTCELEESENTRLRSQLKELADEVSKTVSLHPSDSDTQRLFNLVYEAKAGVET